MTQIFNEQGQQIPCTVVEAPPNPVVQVLAPETSGVASVQLGYGEQRIRRASQERREENPSRSPSAQSGDWSRGESRTRYGAGDSSQLPPRRRTKEFGSPDVQPRRHGNGRNLRTRRSGESHRNVEGPRIPGRREASRLPRRTEHARQHEASPSWLHRTGHRSVASHQGQEDAGTVRQQAAHANAPAHRAHRCGAQSDLHPRRDCRSDERHRPREEAGLTEMAETTTMNAAAFTALVMLRIL